MTVREPSIHDQRRRLRFGRALRVTREARGLSIADVARATGKDPRTVAKWESGLAEPNVGPQFNGLRAILHVDGLTLLDCFDDEGAIARVLDQATGRVPLPPAPAWSRPRLTVVR